MELIQNSAKEAVVLNEVMEKERDVYLQAAAYERSPDRRDYRHGYYERELILGLQNLISDTLLYKGERTNIPPCLN